MSYYSHYSFVASPVKIKSCFSNLKKVLTESLKYKTSEIFTSYNVHLELVPLFYNENEST